MTDTRHHARTRRVATLAAALVVALAATTADARRTTAPTPADDWARAETALQAGDWTSARLALAPLLQRDLRNGHLQFLHALAEENAARDRDRSQLELAAVGYRNAVRFAPGHYWALLNLGFLDLERGDHDAAQERFAEAAMDQPDRWEAFYGLGVASYHRRDLPMLAIAARRAVELAPGDTDVMRLQAFALAAEGDRGAEAAVAKLAAGGEEAPVLRHVARRVGEFLRVAPAANAPQATTLPLALAVNDTAPAPLPPQLPAPAPSNQVVVEVTILLSSVIDQRARGVNLFDGLRALYGYSNTLTQQISNFGRDSTRTIVSAVSTPQLNYSLNLFNDSGQNYSVVARPSITAMLGRQSQFFAGRTVNVAVSGVNLGTLQPIDVGVNLTVTPEQIDDRRVTFQVAATRSFLSQEQAGTFDNSLTVFRQQVSATADIEFGQTLVLSTLSEQVQDKHFSRVPVVGRIPVLDWLTSNTNDLQRQESLLVLVTPTLPLNIDTPLDPDRRAREVQELLRSWHERIDPASNIVAVLDRLHRQNRWLRVPEAGDLRLRLQRANDWQREAIAESLLLARR